MGSVVGEKISRAIDYANNKKYPLIILIAIMGVKFGGCGINLEAASNIIKPSERYSCFENILLFKILIKCKYLYKK